MPEAQTINDRIELFIDERFGGNKAAFAKSIGLSPGMMSSYFGKQRRSKPNVDMIIKITKAFGVNPQWLLTGDGEMLKEVDGTLPTSAYGAGEVAALNRQIAELMSENARLKDELLKSQSRIIHLLETQSSQ